MSARISIVGVSGYSGAVLARLCAEHPGLALAGVVADSWKNDRLGAHLRLPRGAPDPRVSPMAEAAAVASDADVALLATPAEVSARLAPELLARGVRVVDLSGAFRLLEREAYPAWYGFTHPAPELLAEARFGLPELPAAAGDAPSYADARLVANPGCYATAAILALAPLVAAGLAAAGAPIFIDGKSGVTGAGRKVEERLLFAEVAESLSPYRVGTHQHTPEIEQALTRVGALPRADGRAGAASPPWRVTFVPHLLPIRRGLLVTAMVPLRDDAASEDVDAAAARFYSGAAEVEVALPEEVSIAKVASTTRALVALRCDPRTRTAVAVGALDNLMKGAASQALQNVCAMLSIPFSPRSS